MASIVTHYFFGRRFLKTLPLQLQESLKLNWPYYIIGQQGPDPFFFHILFGQEKDPGSRIHKNSLMDFYNLNKDILENSPIFSKNWAYFIGFIGHFSLDICIHRSIAYLEKHLPMDHMLMERELDRHILLEEGIKPHRFLSRNCIPHPRKVSATMYEFYKDFNGVSHQTIKESLYLFRILETLFHVASPFEETMKRRILYKLAIRESIQGKILSMEPSPGSQFSNKVLREDFNSALGLAREILFFFLEYPHSQQEPKDVYCNFNGEKIL